MNIVYKIDNVTFGYDKKIILDDVSADIKEGEFISIVGENGTGKSTLMKLMMGILSPDKGEIKILGNDINKFSDWSSIGYVCQNAIKSNMGFPATAEEVVKANLYSDIGFLRFATKKHKFMTIKALEEVGMAEYAKELVGNLSGGQQQRVMIARAIVNHPKILILDEPAAGIDYKSKISLYSLLKRLNKTLKVTIIMVTHDSDCAADFVNRILYVKDKKITERITDNYERISLLNNMTAEKMEG